MFDLNEKIYWALVTLNTDLRNRYNQQSSPYSLRDACTISWNAGTRTGKTSWLRKVVSLTDLVICVDKSQRQWFLDLKSDTLLSPDQVVTFEEITNSHINKFHGKTYARIFVDNASRLSYDLLYTNLRLKNITGPDTLIVCLG